jgi:hypothetical protein
MTPVRGRRGRVVHWMANLRRDLTPEDSARKTLCARTLRGPIVVDEEIDCPACVDIIERAN